jgi:hypothetical protein
MRRNTVLVVLTAIGSATCWWPLINEPSLDLPFWRPPLVLALVALGTGLATVLSDMGWALMVRASIVGTVVGLCVGFWIWWPSDGIAASFVGVGVGVATLATAAVVLVVGFALKRFSLSNRELRLVAWCGLLSCVASGPVVAALTPPLVAHRVATNDRLTAERFAALRNAVQQSLATAGDPARKCEGAVLRLHYSGPPFSESSWRYIYGNAVKENGYLYDLRCGKNGEYRLDVVPAREKGDGTLRFCADQSGTSVYTIGRNQWMRSPCAPSAQ